MEQEGGNMNMMNRQVSQQQGSGKKCPRCDSDNTKFCYYNNYSFAQPRYFCKTCRRYWTQGGTLRNVPVGGGGRAGKKGKNSSSSSSSSVARQQPLTAAVRGRDPSLAAVPYGGGGGGGGGGGYLSSLAALHNPLNQSSQSQYFNPHQSMMMSSSSNMGLLSGLNFTAAGSSVQRQFRPSPFYSGEREQMMSLYGSGQGGLVPSQNVWPQTQSFINNNSLWSTFSTTSSISQPQRNASAASASSSSSSSSSSFFNNQWHDLSRYNPHP